MKFEDFSKEQQQAISESGHNIIVSAGAGSGKTEVLTQRVLYFVTKMNYKLDEFLILTFTRLAADVMKSRIRKALNEVGSSEANMVDFADITTFDSYALSLVKKYHFLLGVSKNVSIIDSTIISVKKRNIIGEIFNEYYESGQQEFLKIIDHFCFKDDKKMMDLVLLIYEKALLESDTNAYLDNFIDKYYNEEIYQKIYDFHFDNLLKLKSSLIESIYKLPNILLNKTSDTTISELVYEKYERFINSDNYEDILLNFPKKVEFTSPRNLPAYEANKISEYRKLESKFNDLTSHLPSTSKELLELIKVNKDYAKILIEIVKELDRRITLYKKSYDIYEFNDISKMSINLVKNNPEIRDSIKNKLKMIMIDEYQDTSPLQEEFINLIANDNVYMVGDVKQSIYRFRNADSKIFTDKYNKYKQHDDGNAIELNRNFRSRKEVLEDINYIFERIMSDEYGGANYAKDHLIEFGNKKFLLDPPSDNRHSEFLISKYKTSEEIATNEATSIAKDIINKINNSYHVMDAKTNNLRPCIFSDFAILMDRGKEFDTYAKVFNEYHIPLYIENDDNIATNSLILTLNNLIKLVHYIKENDYENKDFAFAFTSLARSFILEYNDNDIYEIVTNKKYDNDKTIIYLKNIIQNNLDLSNANLLEEIIYGLNIYEKLIKIGDVSKNITYIETFLSLFKEMTKLDYSLMDFASYLNYIDDYDLKINLSSMGSNFNSVKIMNIHKSKGLEFNIVYYPGLHKSFNRIDIEKQYGVSKNYGLILPTTRMEELNLILPLHQADEIKDDLSERIRLLYVALTRAKEKMIFVESKKENDYEGQILEKLSNIRYGSEFYYVVKQLAEERITKTLFDTFIKMIDYEINSDKLKELIEKLKDKKPDETYFYNLDFKDSILLNVPSRLALEAEKEFYLKKINEAYINQEFSDYTFFNLIRLYFKEYPYESLTREILKRYLASDISKESLITIIQLTRYDFNPELIKLIDKKDEKILSYEFDKIFNFDTDKVFENSLKISENPAGDLLKEVVENVIKREYDKDKFIELIYLLGFKSKEKYHDSTLEDIIKIVSDRYEEAIISMLELDLINYNRFKNLIDWTSNYFTHYTLDDKDFTLNKTLKDEIKQELLEVKEFNFEKEEINEAKASKELNLNTDLSGREFGSKLHFALEVTNFKNPEYTILDNRMVNIIKRFLDWDILTNINDANIYKEYEFYDDVNLVNGVIDLLIVYKDKIDIIDYKTKNIEDTEYDKQLYAYRDFIIRKFNKPTNIYLYSLLTGKSRLVK